jgi:hypothetical protein
MRLARCFSIVLWLSDRACAISRVRRPAAIRRMTWRSRSVRSTAIGACQRETQDRSHERQRNRENQRCTQPNGATHVGQVSEVDDQDAVLIEPE